MIQGDSTNWLDRFMTEVRDWLQREGYGLGGKPVPDTQNIASSFVAQIFGHEMKWVKDQRDWYLCSRTNRKNYWSKDDRDGALLRAQAVCQVMGAEARKPAMLTTRFAEETLRGARGVLAARTADFDSDSWILGVKNGVIELRTLTFRDVQPEDMLTKMAPVKYDSDAKCPTWDSHLRIMFRVGEEIDSPTNEEAIDYLQRAVGASLVGEVIGDHFFVMVCGPKRSGKGVLTRVLKQLLGPLVTTVPERVLFGKPDMHSTDLTVLEGARLAVAEELPSLQRMNVARLKSLTGGDAISARKIARDVVEFQPSHSLWITANNMPDTGYEAFGPIAERVRILRTGPTVPYEARSADWPERLEAELPGILNWALEGLRKWQAAEYRLPQEDWMRLEVEEWETGQDPLSLWYDECLEPVEGVETPTSLIWQSFSNWWMVNRGKQDRMPNSTEVGSWLKERGHSTRRVGQKKIPHRKGVRIRPGIFAPKEF